VAITDCTHSDRSLPPYHVIKNLILVTGAMDDWDEADIPRLQAEQAYIAAFRRVQKDEIDSLEVLQDLCDELDQLQEFKRQDISAMLTAERFTGPYDMEDLDEEYVDETELAAVGNADEVAAETLMLPSASQSSTATLTPNIVVPPISVTSTVETSDTSTATAAVKGLSGLELRSIRKPKSRKLNLGGAVRAQDWARKFNGEGSLQGTSGSGRANV
jgi:hypothetical protein